MNLNYKRIIRNTVSVLAIASGVFFGARALESGHNYLSFKHNVKNHVSEAAKITSPAIEEGAISIQESLDIAYENAKKWEGEDPAIIWETSFTNIDDFRTILSKTSQESKELSQLEKVLDTGVMPGDASEWVRNTAELFQTKEDDPAYLKRIAYGHKVETINSSYEALNNAIKSDRLEYTDTEDKPKKIPRQESLASKVGYANTFYSTITGKSLPYKEAAACIHIAAVYTKMGNIPDALIEMKKADEHLEDEELKKSISFAIKKIQGLNNQEEHIKYSPGWWSKTADVAKSLDGDMTSVLNIADHISFRYGLRFLGTALLSFGSFFMFEPITNRRKKKKEAKGQSKAE